jgi:LmbE family N-acetylglucosaminyl deacetylase
MNARRAVRFLLVVATLGLVLVPAVNRLARRLLRTLCATLLRLRAHSFDALREPGLILIFAPHPDDETLGCGGLIALRRQAGRPVAIAFITDGAASHPGYPGLAALRAAEAQAAAAALGLPASDLHFLAAPDGELSRLAPAARTALLGKISSLHRSLAPALIFLPCHRDGSDEHDAAFALVAAALSDAPRTAGFLEFPVWSWWNPLLLLRPIVSAHRIHRLDITAVLPRKLAALSCYRTQIVSLGSDRPPVLSAEYLRSFATSAEYYFRA